MIVLKCEFTTIGTFGNFQSLNDRCPAPSTLKQPTLDIDVGSFFAFSIIHNLQSLVWNCFQFALRFTFKLSNIKYEKRRMEPGFLGIFCVAGRFSWDILCRRILWKMAGNWRQLAPITSRGSWAPSLLHLADSRAGNNGEWTRGGVLTGQGVAGRGNPQNVLTLVNC